MDRGGLQSMGLQRVRHDYQLGKNHLYLTVYTFISLSEDLSLILSLAHLFKQLQSYMS